MMGMVLGVGHHLQVLPAIVVTIPVPVVNMLV
jgi:hypothetical protein